MVAMILVTPSFGIEIEDGRLRVVTDHGLLLVSGEVAASTAARLRVLANECDRVLPPPVPPALGDLFDGDA
ncbi:hypothetical protein SAMN04244581_01951 [Paracoccus denitrificans]|jgi:hypothetical protein|nr:hypothetical protein SAMN04244581_01951 [Paracoccus denitrificans]SFR05886.1 hypothetical protein SAMN04244569_01929 [Paracoccus denitrificans]